MLDQELLRTLSVISPEEQALLAGQQLNREIYMDMGARPTSLTRGSCCKAADSSPSAPIPVLPISRNTATTM